MTEGEERTVLYERGEMLNQIEALQQENEQLQAQVERYREALKLAESRFKVIEQATEYVKPGTGVWHTVGIALQEICKALSDSPVKYHNPADVAALKKAMEALELILKKHTDIPNHNRYPSSTSICRKAIAAIDKIGGQEDV